MKTFLIYHHPTKGYVVIKEGFSWPAFFFWWIWAFVKQMWGLSIVMFIFAILIGAAWAAPPVGIILTLIFSIIVGSKGNQDYKKVIESRGYKFMTRMGKTGWGKHDGKTGTHPI